MKVVGVIILSVLLVGLSLIQFDALFANTPKLGSVWAREYLQDLKAIDQRTTNQTVPGWRSVEGDPTMEYNRATMFAERGESLGGEQQREAWEQAIKSYQKLLERHENTYARHNLEILESLVDQLQQQQENSQQEQQQNSEQNGEQSQGDQNEQNQQEENTQGGSDDSNSEEGGESGSEGGGPQESGLSQEDIRRLQGYQQQLQQQQFQNQQYFGKQSQDTPPQSIFDQFFGSPKFRQNIQGVERDW